MSQEIQTSGDRKLDKRLKHECLDCTEQALPDSDFCSPHRDANRKRARDGGEKRRKERREKGRCVDCGLKSKRARCMRCYRKQNVVKGRPTVVKESPRGHFKHETGTHAWGSGVYQTQRYVGKARRGRLTREEQAEEDKRDARFAIAELEKFILEADRLVTPDVLELPRIQREAERRKATLFLGNAGRFIEGLEDKYGGS